MTQTYQVIGLDADGCTLVSREAYTMVAARAELKRIDVDTEYNLYGDLRRLQIVRDTDGARMVDQPSTAAKATS